MSVQLVSMSPPARPDGRVDLLPVRALVVGMDLLSREGMRELLRHSGHVQLESAGGQVDVVVIIADRVDADTLLAVGEARTEFHACAVVVVSDLDARGLAMAVAAGAAGIVPRSEVTLVTVDTVVRAVAGGEAVVPRELLAGLIGHGAQGEVQARRPGRHTGRSVTDVDLDDREVAVLRLLSEGSDTREIAQRMCYSERTVKVVIQDITSRKHLRNRAHAVAYALRHGLI